MNVRILSALVLCGVCCATAEEANAAQRTAASTKAAPPISEETLGPVVLLSFSYASNISKPLSDGTYTARLHSSVSNQLIQVRFSEEGLAYMRTATRRPQVAASGTGGAVVAGGAYTYCVYGRPYTLPRHDAKKSSVPETAYWLVGQQKIIHMGGSVFYRW